MRPHYIVEWVVDSGAAITIMQLADCKSAGFKLRRLGTPLPIQGVGGTPNCEYDTMIKSFNELSVGTNA